jgi:HPt (histidine-containing phosphotransfer) domain-containing protein
VSERSAFLVARFRERLDGDLAVLTAAPVDAAQLQHVVHQLAGAAGMFGLPEIGRLAALADEQLHEGRSAAAELRALVTSLEAAVRPG